MIPCLIVFVILWDFRRAKSFFNKLPSEKLRDFKMQVWKEPEILVSVAGASSCRTSPHHEIFVPGKTIEIATTPESYTGLCVLCDNSRWVRVYTDDANRNTRWMRRRDLCAFSFNIERAYECCHQLRNVRARWQLGSWLYSRENPAPKLTNLRPSRLNTNTRFA